MPDQAVYEVSVKLLKHYHHHLSLLFQKYVFKMIFASIGPMCQIINLNSSAARYCLPAKRAKYIPTHPKPAVETRNASPTWRQRSGGHADLLVQARHNTAMAAATSSGGAATTGYVHGDPSERTAGTPAPFTPWRRPVVEESAAAAAAASSQRLSWASARTVSSNTSSVLTPPTAWICRVPAAGAAPPRCLRN